MRGLSGLFAGRGARATYGVALAASVCLIPVFAGLPANAAETQFCVACEGPSQNYLCSAAHAQGLSAAVIKYECIVELARAGGHTACTVSRSRPETCRGELRTVDLVSPPGFAANPWDATRNAESAPAPDGQPQVLTPLAAQPPQDPTLGAKPSVARMTKRAIRASRSGVSNAVESRPVRSAAQGAGQRIGRFARCAGKLFRKCRDDTGDTGDSEFSPLPGPAFTD